MSLYEVLWLTPSATDYEIKNNYKRLATAFHPDKHTQGEAQESSSKGFRNLEVAYRVLSNKITRGIYDAYGLPGLKVYDSNKQYFEDIDKEDQNANIRAIRRYQTVKLMEENSKMFDKISSQKAVIHYNMMAYMTRLSARLASSSLPYGRIQSLNYSATVNITKGYSAGLSIDTDSSNPIPEINMSTSFALSLFTKNLYFTLNKDLTRLGSGELEMSKWNVGNL
jgi:DnaJ-class molecular chaperone